jgi:hypothetical protein
MRCQAFSPIFVFLWMAAFVVLVGEEAFPGILVAVFILDSKQHFLTNCALEGEGFVLGHWLPILDSAGVHGSSPFA